MSYRVSVRGTRFVDPNEVLRDDRHREAELTPPPEPVVDPAKVPPAPVDAELAPAESLVPPASPPAPTERPQPKDYSQDLAAAQEQARKGRLLAGLGQAAQSAITATSGVKSDYFDDATRDADRPIHELEQRMQIESATDKVRKANEDADPSSAANRAAQDVFIQAYPVLGRKLGANLGQMTRKDLEEYFKVGDKTATQDLHQKQLAALTDYRQSQDVNADAERARKGSEFQAKLPIEQKKADAAERNSYKVPFGFSAAAGENRAAVQGRHVDNSLISYNKDTNKLQPLAAEMDEIERLAPGLLAGKVPDNVHFGPAEAIARQLPMGLGAQFTPKDDLVLGSMLQKLQTDIQHGTAGANLTDNEKVNYAQIFQSALGSPPEVKAAVLASFRRKLFNEFRTKEAAYSRAVPEEAWQDFYNRGGYGPRSPLFKDYGAGGAPPSAPPPAADGKVTVTNGKETFRIPRSELPGAKADGFHEVP